MSCKIQVAVTGGCLFRHPDPVGDTACVHSFIDLSVPSLTPSLILPFKHSPVHTLHHSRFNSANVYALHILGGSRPEMPEMYK